jgi:hypothetical protein
MGGSGRGGQGGPSAEELSNAQYNIRPSQEDQEKAVDAVTGAYGGGPNIKAVAAMAKNAANRGTGQGLRTISQEALPYSGAKQIANNPTRQITGPSKADLLARDRAARATAREEGMAAENARRYGLDPKAPGYEGAAGAVRKNLGEDNFSLGMKRGGKAKAFASGGSVSSASSRGDGIASRGKTRGKIC